MSIIPAVDVLGGRVVRLVEGDYDRVTVYGDDPVGWAKGWNDSGAEIVHVVDLAAARSGEAGPALWESMAAGGVRFQVGGGIRDATTAASAVDAGAARVVMGTAAVWHPEILAEAVGRIGTARVVAAIDVRGGKATGAGWLDGGRALDGVLAAVVDAGVRTALVTGIGTDGTMQGPDLALLAEVRRLAPDLSIIASGGVGSLADLHALATSGVRAAIVGRALYENRFSLADALAVALSLTGTD